LLGDTLYIGNTDGVVAFPYTLGAIRLTARGRKVTELKPVGHWTRSLLPSADGRKLFVGVGSFSNIGERGLASATLAVIRRQSISSRFGQSLSPAHFLEWHCTTWRS
jgi:glucose/arabinose dehydrogenase